MRLVACYLFTNCVILNAYLRHGFRLLARPLRDRTCWDKTSYDLVNGLQSVHLPGASAYVCMVWLVSAWRKQGEVEG